jgi:integrase
MFRAYQKHFARPLGPYFTVPERPAQNWLTKRCIQCNLVANRNAHAHHPLMCTRCKLCVHPECCFQTDGRLFFVYIWLCPLCRIEDLPAVDKLDQNLLRTVIIAVENEARELAPATRKAYASTIRAIMSFVAFLGLQITPYDPFPANVLNAVLTVAHTAPFSRSVNTLHKYVAAVNYAHRMAELPQISSPLIQALLKGFARHQEWRPPKILAHTRADLQRIYELPVETDTHLRHLAAFTVLLLGGLRGNELRCMKARHLVLHDTYIEVFLPYSKRDQYRKGYTAYWPVTTNGLRIPVKDILVRYLRAFPPAHPRHRLFSCNQQGTKISYATLVAWLTALRTRAGLPYATANAGTHCPRGALQSCLQDAQPPLPTSLLAWIMRRKLKGPMNDEAYTRFKPDRVIAALESWL